MPADSVRSARSPRGLRAARWVPFLVVGASSVWAAGRAPDGRRPPEFDWTLSPDAVLRALGKGPHVVFMLLLFLLAVLAVGLARRWWAAAMTLAIGIAWELVQITVVGHHPRLADLVPDMVGIAVGLLLTWAVASLARRRSGRTPRNGPASYDPVRP